MIRYITQYERKETQSLFILWPHKGHPIPCPYGWAMGIFSEFFGEIFEISRAYCTCFFPESLCVLSNDVPVWNIPTPGDSSFAPEFHPLIFLTGCCERDWAWFFLLRIWRIMHTVCTTGWLCWHWAVTQFSQCHLTHWGRVTHMRQ